MDAIPGLELQITWGKECWENVCKNAEVEYELPDRILGLVHAVSSPIPLLLTLRMP